MGEMIHLPRATFERLKMYRKALESVKKPFISSDEIAKFLEINPELVRKDLSYLKCQGKPRVGYDVEELRKELNDLFGVNSTTNMIIVGANDLARALVNQDFSKVGVKIVAVLDIESENVGKFIGEFSVREMDVLERVMRRFNVEIAALCISRDKAQATAEILIKNGIKAIWNFTGVHLELPSNVIVVDEDLTKSLLTIKHLLK
ncbi:redox-sensing transcriptional repressor Rex [Thermotoga neapolitana]|uniref:Redox-sensing transcriptional repressor Rex n=1 Tax=Thermotoga neapolitana (strain ATCC 49049 / DSM 4359 / NBRC 107923 / NS-E) TaxID=309803 RepID=B9K8F9_THENN|nr:redox-sensing transcriptional repressor Rex [Thermotoga neapolitana]ACM23242.1 Redox-sensing transcriptional repressor rex 2 [Thermotoga neapolitana DSM 4359]KFZ21743.1 redox-sensing transcriptional repressor Rex [Thermotoga neapolitana LA10]